VEKPRKIIDVTPERVHVEVERIDDDECRDTSSARPADRRGANFKDVVMGVLEVFIFRPIEHGGPYRPILDGTRRRRRR